MAYLWEESWHRKELLFWATRWIARAALYPFFRMKIEPPEALETMTVDKVLITKIETSDNVRKKLSDLGVRQEDIVTYQEL